MVGPRIYKRKGRERWIVTTPFMAHGRLTRKSREFSDEERAKAYFAEASEAFPRVGAAGLALDAAARADYWAARALLPEGVSLADVAREWARRNPSGLARDVAPLAAEWLAYKEARSESVRSIEGRRQILSQFLEQAEIVTVGDLDDADGIEAFLWRRLPNGRRASGATARSGATVIRGFCDWLVKRKRLLPANPMELVALPAVDRRAPRALGAAEVGALLREAASRPGAARHGTGKMAAFYALCALAGLRPSEVERLEPEDLRLDVAEPFARVSKRKRGRGMRLVPIAANLRAWLEACPPQWPIKRFARLDERIRAAAGLRARWQDDILRHTWISARLALGVGENQVALEAGNSPAVIHTYYRALMTREEAKALFEVWP